MTRLPIIDISPFLPQNSSSPTVDEDKHRVAQELDKACRGHGFFYLTGHGVPTKLGEEVLEMARKWFLNASEEEREAIKRRDVAEGGDGARGYQRVGENVTKGKKVKLSWRNKWIEFDYESTKG